MFEHVEAYVAVCCYSRNYWLFCSKSTSDQCAESDRLKFVQNQIRTK